jgi:ribosomal protein S12 methylthiotransferase
MPDLALRTTLLVGFPGESERDFEELLAFVEETRFDWLGAFAFSREEGTAAYDLPNQVPAAVKRRRLRRIMDAQRRISRARNEDWVGKEIEVVVEGQHNGAWVGRWKRAAPEVDGQVLFTGRSAALRPGTFLRARVTAAQDYDLVVTRSRPGTSNPRS